MSKKRLTKLIKTDTVDLLTGEIVNSEEMQEWRVPREEPDYVKLYLDAVLAYNDIAISNTPILLELLKHMSYADDDVGQVIILNKFIKDNICSRLDIKMNTLTKNISKLCEGKIFKRIATGTYQVNPYIFGKGDWNSIKNLRASFDWEHGFIVTETEHVTNAAKNRNEEIESQMSKKGA